QAKNQKPDPNREPVLADPWSLLNCNGGCFRLALDCIQHASLQTPTGRIALLRACGRGKPGITLSGKLIRKRKNFLRTRERSSANKEKCLRFQPNEQILIKPSNIASCFFYAELAIWKKHSSGSAALKGER